MLLKLLRTLQSVSVVLPFLFSVLHLASLHLLLSVETLSHSQQSLFFTCSKFQLFTLNVERKESLAFFSLLDQFMLCQCLIW